MPKIVCSQQVRDNLRLQKEYQSDQTNAEDGENGYIVESECCWATVAGRTRTPKRPFDKLIADSLWTMSLQCPRNPQALIQSYFSV